MTVTAVTPLTSLKPLNRVRPWALDGLRGLVADSKAYTPRTLGLCRETGMGLVTLVPRTCGIRQEVESMGPEASVVTPVA